MIGRYGFVHNACTEKTKCSGLSTEKCTTCQPISFSCIHNEPGKEILRFVRNDNITKHIEIIL